MENPFTSFRQSYDFARDYLLRKLETDQETAVRIEKEKLDEEYAHEVKKREADDARQITLALASSLSILLKNDTVQPTEWIYDAPRFEMKGWPIKRPVQDGMHQQIALEGWPLELNLKTNKDLIQTSPYQLVLTPDQNVNLHQPLVWYEKRRASNGYGYEPVTKDDIQPLSRSPLSPEDMPWPNPNYHPGSRFGNIGSTVNGASSSFFIDSEPDPAVTAQMKKLHDQNKVEGRAGSPSDINLFLEIWQREQRKADYDLYRKLKIENKIQTAMAKLAARHNIIG